MPPLSYIVLLALADGNFDLSVCCARLQLALVGCVYNVWFIIFTILGEFLALEIFNGYQAFFFIYLFFKIFLPSVTHFFILKTSWGMKAFIACSISQHLHL